MKPERKVKKDDTKELLKNLELKKKSGETTKETLERIEVKLDLLLSRVTQ
jgi:hypothetical protein